MAHEFIEHMLEDHEKQRKMGDQLREAKSADERKRLWQEMYKELSGHLIGEEASVFPYLQEAGGKAREGANEALQEHHVAKLLIRELNDREIDGETWHAKVYVLDEINKHHIDEEEAVHFPMLQTMASRQQLDKLYKQYEEAEEKAKENGI